MGVFHWLCSGIRIRQRFWSKSLVPWSLDYVNATYVGIFYFKQISKYYSAMNAKTCGFESFFHLFLFRNTISRTRPKSDSIAPDIGISVGSTKICISRSCCWTNSLMHSTRNLRYVTFSLVLWYMDLFSWLVRCIADLRNQPPHPLMPLY